MRNRVLVVITGLFVGMLVSAACKNPNYCEGNPNNDCRISPDGPDASAACTTSADCSATAPVCEPASSTCVQCIAGTDATACTGTTPICDADHVCRACQAHSECPSEACGIDGACIDPSQVAYVAATGSGTACTQTAPCALLSQAVATNLPFIKVAASGAARANASTIIDGKAVTILAEPGAVLDRDGDGPLLEVRSAGANVIIYDLTLTGATSASGVGLLLTPNGGMPSATLVRATVTNNQGGGITTSGGALTVQQSTIASNQGGGISVSGTGATFAITNNMIFRNGDQNVGTYGGVSLTVAVAGSNTFELNTVVDNVSKFTSAGVACTAAGIVAPNNIIARNALSGSTTAATAQTSGACTFPTSKVQTDVAGLGFASADNLPYSYKLTAGSSAVDAATTPSTVVVDIDGDTRPNGAARDCGADELVP